MKTLTNFLTLNPSYCKCGNERIAKATGLSPKTVARFKNTDTFRNINQNYRNKN